MRFLSKLNYLYTLILIFATVACSSNSQQPNTLSEKEESEGWTLLFNGKNLDGWHLYNNRLPSSAWMVIDDYIYCDPNSESDRIDLVSNQQFENYELKFEWKLEKEGNSGVFINVKEEPSIAQTFFSGPEYQLLEDSHMDFNLPLKKSGCLYNFTPQLNSVRTKMQRQWNESRIVQKDGKIEFYLNGHQTAKMDFNSEQWHNMVSKSNFKDYPQFGKYTKGHIALQDWSRGVSFRNIKIKQL
ncbi:3-keto-disaccharide hydrolase [Sphingobacterium composti Ten et al. 2007 non Yoo et al. 2007]|uniref:3-keto-disaccharide hydrolase n=1 Tax=Sphingobacterium composti TaxID=363260 RepID=UPI00135C20E7|nr:DUF1080 domain-containing protein [Sphingobacterium composti Ten et al. 2007 non Yoo et al. 2007]